MEFLKSCERIVKNISTSSGSVRQTVASGVTFAHEDGRLNNSLEIQLKFHGIPQKPGIYCKNHANLTRLGAPNSGFWSHICS